MGISPHLLTEMLCFHFLRVGQKLYTTHFITRLCLVLELGPRAVPSSGITEVSRTPWFAQATEGEDSSLTGFDKASWLFNNKYFWVRANKNKYQQW